ncbi:DeoR/GlpR family DNA-binding transcription regulator [Thermatribacter velox]|uniref:DeoR/GlpR family DNA-binding transcription regulator n=1 Tax=Thermatribacter velox TaxID=3039681 RepID=A0ABZ2YC19_9BACT
MSKTQEKDWKILNLVFKKRALKVKDIADLLGISESTVRRAVGRLEQSERVVLNRGFVSLHPNFVSRELTFYEKLSQNIEAKRRIGKKAAELINDGESVLLETGTTVLQIVPHLKTKRDVTVITNCLKVATEVASLPNLRLVLIGGEMRKESTAFVGHLAEETLRKVFSETFISKVFLGADGISPEEGVTTHNIQEAIIDRMMIELARETVLVADHSKFGKVGLYRIVPLEKVDVIVTDRIDGKQESYLREAGVEIILA